MVIAQGGSTVLTIQSNDVIMSYFFYFSNCVMFGADPSGPR